MATSEADTLLAYTASGCLRAARNLWRWQGPTLAVFLLTAGILLLTASGVRDYLDNRDHGIQLALGTQILHGQVPVRDFDFYAGPAIWYLSALGLALSGSLIGETVLCALGYAAALALLFRAAARGSSVTAGLVSTAAALLLLPRFYKWYFALAPLAVLTLWLRHRRWGSRRSAWELALGVGVVSLLRPDLGATSLVAVLALTLLPTGPDSWVRRRRDVLILLAGAAVPHAVWLVYLTLAGGAGATFDYLYTQTLGSLGAASGLGVPFPTLDLSNPWGRPSRLAPGYFLVPCLFFLGLVRGLRRLRRDRRDPVAGALVASAVVGASTLHQTLHRSDGQHLLQVLPLSLVLLPLLVSDLRRREGGRWQRPAALVLVALALVAAWGLWPYGRVDLRPPWSVGQRYRGLADPLRNEKHRVIQAVRELRRQTAADERVLIFPLDPQLYVLADRPMAGRLSAYYAGVFDRPPWSERNLDELRRHPPVRVLVPTRMYEDDWRPESNSRRGREAHRGVDDFILERYREITYDNGHYTLRRPTAGDGTAPGPSTP